MNFCGRMPMGFSGDVSLISGLTVLELAFMGLTGSNSCLFRAPGFIVSPVGKGERGQKRRREGRKKGIEKEWKEERKKE